MISSCTIWDYRDDDSNDDGGFGWRLYVTWFLIKFTVGRFLLLSFFSHFFPFFIHSPFSAAIFIASAINLFAFTHTHTHTQKFMHSVFIYIHIRWNKESLTFSASFRVQREIFFSSLIKFFLFFLFCAVLCCF